MAKKYILFDNDGVLVDTEYRYFLAAQNALAEIGITLDREQYLSDMAKGLGSWVHARSAGVDEDAINKARIIRDALYLQYLQTEPIEVDGVMEALHELSRFAHMAIVTTAKRVDFDVIHKGRDILRFMDFAIVREDYQKAKPHPEPYLMALARFGCAKAEAVVVEDSQRGLNSAHAAGIDCVIVHNAFTQFDDFTRSSAKIEKLSHLKQLISNWE